LTQAFQAQVANYAQPNGQPAAQQLQGLASFIHAEQKVGKSSLCDTGPAPRLTLDVENAAIWTPSRKTVWDPMRQTVPVPDGSWETCLVHVRDYTVLDATYQILNRGQHPFNSVGVDSVPVIQDRVMRSFAGYDKMSRDDWGRLLRLTTGLIWNYKDLLTHPTRQVWAVTFVAGSHWDEQMRKWRPNLVGSSAHHVPFAPDIEGFMSIGGDGLRHMWIGPSPHHETGNRLWGRLPDDLVIGHPGYAEGWTIESMVRQVIQR
jgi:hypothetical protein